MLPDAYFAGFFDADGCVHIGRKRNAGPGRHHFAFRCQVAQVDVNVLTRFRERFGGSVRGDGRTGERTRTGNPVYQWAVSSREAEAFLRAVLPYLVLKRERAELGLLFREMCTGENVLPRTQLDRPHVAAKRERILMQRGGLCDRMTVLNRRGRDGVRPG